MKLPLYQVDAFTDRLFGGNYAAVMPLPHWLDDAVLQAIAAENNVSETAFLVEQQPGHFAIRWFSPLAEIDFCGHATLARYAACVRHNRRDGRSAGHSSCCDSGFRCRVLSSSD